MTVEERTRAVEGSGLAEWSPISHQRGVRFSDGPLLTLGARMAYMNVAAMEYLGRARHLRIETAVLPDGTRRIRLRPAGTARGAGIQRVSPAQGGGAFTSQPLRRALGIDGVDRVRLPGSPDDDWLVFELEGGAVE